MSVDPLERRFMIAGDSRYVLEVGGVATFTVDRLRRERNELVAELTVLTDLPGALVFQGNILHAADFNLSSATARKTRATILRERTHANELDWAGYLEQLCVQVIAAERRGQGAIDLRDAECPPADDTFRVLGFHIPKRHPSIIFGDGGSLKSLVAGLAIGGRLAEMGERVGLFDWELGPEDHKARLVRLFGADAPEITYVRCERPLVHDVDRLARIAREHDLSFGIFDSVAFACDGPPEAAEAAAGYYRARRQIGIGGIDIAHITKGDNGDQKPFGSAFWSNGARATWHVKRAEGHGDSDGVDLLVTPRKCNLGPLRPAFGLRVTFGDRITIDPADATAVDDFAAGLPIWQRVAGVLKSSGPTPLHAIADAVNAKPDSIERVLRRDKRRFTCLNNPSGVRVWALRDRSDRSVA